jgi:hypothetical protein
MINARLLLPLNYISWQILHSWPYRWVVLEFCKLLFVLGNLNF